MADSTVGSGKSSSTASVTDLHAGLYVKAPKAIDSSMKLGSASVNDGATRGEVAKTPPTLGPRTA